MGCGCKHGDDDDFRFDERAVRTVGTLKVNLPGLRKALGGRPEILVAMEALSFAPKTNDARMWRHFTTSVYQSSDLPVLATREALQNSVDAVRAAVRKRQLRAGDGRFSVTWDPARRTLTWEDNGVGMDAATVANKFLSLGDTGKEGAEDSSEAAGGFGVAKAVILGVSPTFRYELHTRDKKYISEGFDKPPKAPVEAPHLAGTRLTVFDIPERFDSFYVYVRSRNESMLDRLRDLLAHNDLPDIELALNGERVRPFFSGKRGHAIAAGSWGGEVTSRARGYNRGVGDRRGAFYVRLNGLYQFSSSARELPTDVVIDLSTRVRPGAAGYPLNAARDGFQGTAASQFWTLQQELEREALSAARANEYEVIEPEEDGTPDGMALAESTRAAFMDPGFRQAMEEAADGVAELLLAELRIHATQQPHVPESAAPAGSGPKLPSPIPGLSRGPKSAADMLSQVLREADQAAQGKVLDAAAEQALAQLEAGHELTAGEAQSLTDAADRATEAAADPGGGGFLQVAQVDQALRGVLPAGPAKQRNPFGKFAGIRIAKKKYDPKRARRFKREWVKWVPYLTVWDAVLRLMAADGRIPFRFKPGFVLEDNVVGMCGQGQNGAIIYIHPDRFKEYATAHAQRPLALAAFLHGLAAHELAHLKRGGGEGHDERFASVREDLGHSTAHMLPAFARLCSTVLKLPSKETPEQKRIRELQVALEKARARGRAGKSDAESKRLREQLAQAEAERAELLEKAERAGRRAVTMSCPECVRRVEEAVQVIRKHAPPDIPRARLERLLTFQREKIAELLERVDRGQTGTS
jgi:hypothetical protein